MAKANENDKKITKYLLIGLGVVVFLAMVGSSSDKSKTTETKPEEQVEEVIVTPTPEPDEIETTSDPQEYLNSVKIINDKLATANNIVANQFTVHIDEVLTSGTQAQKKAKEASQDMIDGCQEMTSLIPPAKYEEFHQMITDACKDWNDSSVLIQQSLEETDPSKKSNLMLQSIPLTLNGQEKYNKAADILESLETE